MTSIPSPSVETSPLDPTQRGVDKNGWRILGPGGGGAQYIPTIKPDDPETALVACDMTGAYVTHNGGQTWRELNFHARVGAFAFDPSNPNIVYTGATGLYRSQDSGLTWSLVFPNPETVTGETYVGDHAEHSYISTDNWPGGKIEAILVDPANSRRLFLGIACGRLALFASSDGGQSWTDAATLEGTQFVKSYLDPSSPIENRSLFLLTDAGLFEYTPGNGAALLKLPAADEFSDFCAGLLPGTHQPALFLTSPGSWQNRKFVSGFYCSLDRGQTWELLSAGLEADLQPGQGRYLNRVAVSPQDANIIYLSAVEPPDENPEEIYFGIFKSVDCGQTWRWVMRMGRSQPENRAIGWIEKDYPTTWGGAPFFMSVAPSTPDVVYATDWGAAYRTVDGGQTWQQLYCDGFPDGSVSTRGLDVTNIYYIRFDPFDKQHMALACTDIGAFHSKNGGQSWSHTLKGVPEAWQHNCYQIVFDPNVKGKAWAAWSDCHDLPRPKMFKTGRFNHFQGGITRSEDGLETWEPSRSGLPANGVPTDLILDPNSAPGSRTLYAAVVGKGVYKSNNDGKTWSAKNNGIAGSLNAWRLVRLPDGTLYLLVCRGLQGETVIDGAVYRSGDAAETWQPVLPPDGVNFPNDLAFDPENPQRLYLAAWPSPVDGVEQNGGLWQSENGGNSWTNIVDPASHVYGVLVDPNNPATVFHTNFEGSILRSDDHGVNWRRLGGYNFKWAKQPILDPHNPGMLYLTTFGSSVWYGPANGIEGAFEDLFPIEK
jgi:hypothetical protein